MKQIIQDLKSGQTLLEEVPAPQVKLDVNGERGAYNKSLNTASCSDLKYIVSSLYCLIFALTGT